MELDEFIRASTAIEHPPLVPEIRLHLATELTPLWHATESYLNQQHIGAPFWGLVFGVIASLMMERDSFTKV